MTDVIAIPHISVKLVDHGQLCSPQWYRFFEFANAVVVNSLNTKVDQAISITAGNGLTGGGDLSADRTLDAKRDLGWTASTGTQNRGAYAAYAGHVASVGYIQAEAQATDDAIKAASQRITALENALRNNGAIN